MCEVNRQTKMYVARQICGAAIFEEAPFGSAGRRRSNRETPFAFPVIVASAKVRTKPIRACPARRVFDCEVTPVR